MGIATQKKSALIIATLNSFITPFMGSSINIALPAIKKEFHVKEKGDRQIIFLT